jgi:proline iminopeptidase
MTRIVELAGGRSASYEVIGTGATTVLMLPGGPGLGRAYLRPNADLLADAFRSYLVDPHGSGGSTPPADPAGYTPEGHARFYEGVRQALGLGRVVLFGHSFGATTALTHAALFPAAAAACIAVAPFGIGDDVDSADVTASQEAYVDLQQRHAGSPWYEKAQRVNAEWDDRVRAATDAAEISEMMAALTPFYFADPDKPEVIAAMDEFNAAAEFDLAAVKAWMDIAPAVDLRPFLEKITCPTLVLAGALDFVCGPAQARPIAARVPGGRLAVFPGCGHFPDVEAREAYRREVISFAGRAA